MCRRVILCLSKGRQWEGRGRSYLPQRPWNSSIYALLTGTSNNGYPTEQSRNNARRRRQRPAGSTAPRPARPGNVPPVGHLPADAEEPGEGRCLTADSVRVVMELALLSVCNYRRLRSICYGLLSSSMTEYPLFVTTKAVAFPLWSSISPNLTRSLNASSHAASQRGSPAVSYSSPPIRKVVPS